MACLLSELCRILHRIGTPLTLTFGFEANGRSVLNFVYPASCLVRDVSLDDSGLHLCDGCWNQVVRTPKARCGRCSCPLEKPSGNCANCWEGAPAFERALVLAPFYGPMQMAIHALKFQYQHSLGMELGRRLGHVGDYQKL